MQMGKTTFTRVRFRGGSGGYLLLPVLTTTQRDALSAETGQMIYNSTTTQVETYNGSAWVAVGKLYGDNTFLPLSGGTLTGDVTLPSGALLSKLGIGKLIAATRDIKAASAAVAYTGFGFKVGSLPIVIINRSGGASPGIYTIDGDKTIKGWDLRGGVYTTNLSLLFRNPAGGETQSATVLSWDADGFTLSWIGSTTPDPLTFDLLFFALPSVL